MINTSVSVIHTLFSSALEIQALTLFLILSAEKLITKENQQPPLHVSRGLCG